MLIECDSCFLSEDKEELLQKLRSYVKRQEEQEVLEEHSNIDGMDECISESVMIPLSKFIISLSTEEEILPYIPFNSASNRGHRIIALEGRSYKRHRSLLTKRLRILERQ